MLFKISNKSRWIVLGIVSIGLLLVTLDNSILYTALPTIVTEMGATHTEALWIINAYPLVMSGLLLTTGSLGDRVGHKKLFLVGLSIFGLASLAASYSSNPESLIVARGILAVGAASMMPSTLALLRFSFHEPKEFNLAVAIWGSVATIGSSLGPIVSGVLLEHFWWGIVFLINVPVVVLSIIGTLIYVPKNTISKVTPWDIKSAVLFMLGLSGLVLFIKEVFKTDSNLYLIFVSAFLALIGLTLFINRQLKLEHPILKLSIFKIPKLRAGVVGAFVSLFVIGGLQLITSQRYQLIADMTPLHAGLIVSSMAVGALLSSVIGGLLIRRFSLRNIICGGLMICAIGLFVLINGFPSVKIVVSSLLFSGMGLGMVMAVSSSAIVGSVGHEDAGVASSVEEVSYEIGSLIAVSVIGSLMLHVYQTVVKLPKDIPISANKGIEEAIKVVRHVANNTSLEQAVAKAYDHAYIVATSTIAMVVVVSGIYCFNLLCKKRE